MVDGFIRFDARPYRHWPYETGHPATRGGELLLSVPYDDGEPVRGFERWLAREWDVLINGEDVRREWSSAESRWMDNKYGYDCAAGSGARVHVRFHDWTMSVWLMPTAEEGR